MPAILAYTIAVTIAHTEAPPQPEELSRILESREVGMSAIDTEYVVAMHDALPLRLFTNDATVGFTQTSKLHWRWLGHGSRLRLERVTLTGDREGPNDGDDPIVTVWDGQTWWRSFPQRREYIITPELRLDAELDVACLFHQWAGPSVIGSRPLSALPQDAEFAGVEEADGILTYRLFLGGGTTRVLLQVNPDRGHRVESIDVAVLARGGDDEEPQVRNRLHYWIESWEGAGGLEVPAVAHRDVYIYYPQNLEVTPEPYVARVTFRRLSFRDRSLDPPPADAFVMPFQEGWAALDRRFKATYKVGDRKVMLDGTLHQLASPITPDNAPEVIEALRERPEDGEP